MRTVTVLLVAVMLLAGCSTKSGSGGSSEAPVSSNGDFSMTLAFEPTPPKQGSETLIVTVKDSADRQVKGAAVKIGTTMPRMSMTGPNLTAQDNGDGTYSAVTNLNFATKWVFNVRAAARGKSATAEFAQDVP